MSNVLTEICARKRVVVEARKATKSIGDLTAEVLSASPVRPFAAALTAKARDGYALIAEIKRASPSAGLIREHFQPAVIAQAYEHGGAACLSVLTEEDYFQGNDAFLQVARDATKLPALRKDFMLDPYQVVEARAIGADCILLIMAMLSDAQAKELEDTAVDCGMDVLIEVHDAEELDRALLLRSPLIGVNNRNLKTLVTDLATTEHLAARLPKDRVLVCESGLKTPADLARMAKTGARRFLIGESLMKQTDIEAATRAILTPERAHA